MTTSSRVRMDDTVPGVRGEPALKHDDGLGVLELGEPALELHVDGHGAGNAAHRAGAHAELLHRFERPLTQARVRRQTQVVVRREVHDAAAVDGRVRPLLVLDDAEMAVQALCLQALQLVSEVTEGIVTSDRSHGATVVLRQAAGYRRQPAEAADAPQQSSARRRLWSMACLPPVIAAPRTRCPCRTSLSVPRPRSPAIGRLPRPPPFRYAARWRTTCVAPDARRADQAEAGSASMRDSAATGRDVSLRKPAAVAVHEPAPVNGRVEDGPHVPRGDPSGSSSTTASGGAAANASYTAGGRPATYSSPLGTAYSPRRLARVQRKRRRTALREHEHCCERKPGDGASYAVGEAVQPEGGEHGEARATSIANRAGTRRPSKPGTW